MGRYQSLCLEEAVLRSDITCVDEDLARCVDGSVLKPSITCVNGSVLRLT